MHIAKSKLTFAQIINMNVGFFGTQYSFGLQQSGVNPVSVVRAILLLAKFIQKCSPFRLECDTHGKPGII